MSPSLARQIASPLSKLSSSCGILGIMYMAFRKYLNATSQPILGMGPARLDANGGTFRRLARAVRTHDGSVRMFQWSRASVRLCAAKNLARLCKISRRASRTRRATVRCRRDQNPDQVANYYLMDETAGEWRTRFQLKKAEVTAVCNSTSG